MYSSKNLLLEQRNNNSDMYGDTSPAWVANMSRQQRRDVTSAQQQHVHQAQMSRASEVGVDRIIPFLVMGGDA